MLPASDPRSTRVLVLVVAAVLLEGMDLQVVGFAAPAMIAEWQITKKALGPAMAASLIGMMAGAAVGGRLGDLWGRRPLLIASIGSFGAATLLTAFSAGPGMVAMLRILAGLGFGAALSNATALIAETSADSEGFRTASLVSIGVPCGGMLGAAAAAWTLPLLGWRALFAIGGALPCLLAVAMLFLLPESSRYLHLRSRMTAVTGATAAGDPSLHSPHAGWQMLLEPSLRRTTLGLGLAFFANLAVSYAFFSWTPTLLIAIGFPASTGILAALLFNLFGSIGAAAGLYWLMPGGGRRPLLLYATVGLIAVVVLGLIIRVYGSAIPPVGLLLAGLSAAGVATVGLQAALYGLAATAYPTPIRATGIGVAGSVGRAGALVSAFGGGAVLSLVAGASVFLGAIGVLFVLCMIGIMIVDRLPPRSVGPPPGLA